MDLRASDALRQNRDPFFWASIGPICLTCALSALLFQAFFAVWPLVALACTGLLLTWGFGNRGFLFSFLLLIAFVAWKFSFVSAHLWCSLFVGSTALSWMMVLLGKKEVRAQDAEVFSMPADTKDDSHVQELTALNSALQNALRELAKREAEADSVKREMQVWIDRCEALTHEIALFQTREKELECALTEAQTQRVIVPANPIVSQESYEEVGEALSKDVLEIQMKYRQLQGQFQEKTEILTQSRKELFSKEGELILLHKELEEQSASLLEQDRAFHQHLGALEQECRAMELQVVHLEQVISSVLAAKKPSRPRSLKPKKKESLSAVIKGAIDQKQSPQQISLLDV